jgi:hypothetical protein
MLVLLFHMPSHIVLPREALQAPNVLARYFSPYLVFALDVSIQIGLQVESLVAALCSAREPFYMFTVPVLV